MAQCTTTSGSYRCMGDENHTPPCEAQAPEYAKGSHFVRVNGYWFDACKTHKLTKFDLRGCIACAEVQATS